MSLGVMAKPGFYVFLIVLFISLSFFTVHCDSIQSQTTLTAYLNSKQLLLFVFAYSSIDQFEMYAKQYTHVITGDYIRGLWTTKFPSQSS